MHSHLTSEPPDRRRQFPRGDDARKDDAAGKAATRPAESPANPPGFFAQPGEDPPRPFVPLRPSTVDDRRRTEAVRLYIAARALEDQRAWSDAVVLLQEAAKLDPDSIAIARRLCRIYVGALGRPELALHYGRRVLAIDPGDTDTLIRLVDYYKKNDPASAEGLLTRFWRIPSSTLTRRAGCWPSLSWASSTRAGFVRSTRRPTLTPRFWPRSMTSRPTASRRSTSPAFWATTRPWPTSSSAGYSSPPASYDLAVKALERGHGLRRG